MIATTFDEALTEATEAECADWAVVTVLDYSVGEGFAMVIPNMLPTFGYEMMSLEEAKRHARHVRREAQPEQGSVIVFRPEVSWRPRGSSEWYNRVEYVA